MTDERFFIQLAGRTDAADYPTARTPARLKSRLYSTLMEQHAATGPICSLSITQAEGRALCVFERALQMMPLSEAVGSMNPCRICHARILGEHLDRAPIFWAHCPYAEFHRR